MFKIKWDVIKGLLIKDFHRIKRSYIEFILLLLSTLYLSLQFSITFGQYPNDLTIGVVNYEISNFEEFLFIQSASIFDFTKSATPNGIILLSAITMISSSVVSIVQCRSDGVWNRSLLNGVKISEIVITYLIQYSCYAFITSIESILCLKFVFKIEIIGNIWLAFILLFIYAMNSFLFGFNVSIILDDVTIAGFTGIGLLVIFTNLSGIVWPIQGFSKFIQPFQYLFPIPFACVAFHGVIFKGYGIFHKTVFDVLLVLISNSILLLILLCFILKFKSFVH
ncbi:hypothetical protein PVAND_004205 [Polypedilum vanderplanki]|uniref:ABC-2 type transporter transmembrane domain-containing protein n=1 Tax=Polypedilum vanderplanki TaxID=319348 RepID=A0A9J6BWA8_POLVA|nr:hypothetical protein PVAND_004205 [Polypedilum vanderplanki]